MMKAYPVARARRAPLVLLLLVALPASLSADEYPSSVVGTDFDFIRESDPSVFECLEYKGDGPREMPDKRGPSALVQEAFIFVAYYADGTSVDMALSRGFETSGRARKEALRYAPRLGRLPTSLRRGVKRLVVHTGGRNTTAFSDIGLIVVYADNATKRIGTHDLEETLFHESVHAAWDREHARSSAWRQAQEADGTFITRYARKNPKGEDLAESALFAYTLLHHPDRIPAADAERIRRAIPGRIAFVAKLLPPGEPIFRQVGPKYGCDDSGTTFTVKRPNDVCTVDLSKVGQLSDILSNALMLGLNVQESKVTPFLTKAQQTCETSEALLEATAARFGFDRATLHAQVEAFRHVNCDHGPLTAEPTKREPAPEAHEPGSPSAQATPTAAAVPMAPDREDDGTRTLLYAILAIALASLIVSTVALIVALKRPRA